MESKTKGKLSIIFGIIGIIILPIIFGPLAIYFGIKSKKEKVKKLGNIGLVLGIISLVLMLISPLISNFIIYPALGKMLNTPYPVLASVSGSMSHDGKFDSWWNSQKSFYLERNISKEEFELFSLSSGYDAGDILINKGVKYEDLKVGDVVLYSTSTSPDPIAHRIVRIWKDELTGEIVFQTKGDHNPDINQRINEGKITKDRYISKVSSKISKLGWIKIWKSNLLV